jgi:hypothetical protein
MSHLSLWILPCLFGFTCLNATELSIDSSTESSIDPSLEAICRRPDFAIPNVNSFAFVYNNNAKTKLVTGPNLEENGYKVDDPIIFNSEGPARRITFDRNMGELIIPSSGTYEVKYSIYGDVEKSKPNPIEPNEFESTVDFMALQVNGEEIEQSRVGLVGSVRFFATATYVLQLNANDRLALTLPETPQKREILFRGSGKGNSASLFVRKL